MSDAAFARRALGLIDLTELGDSCSEAAVDDLCRRAVGPPAPVAAICIWPQHVSRARAALEDAPVRIATVANFPSGDLDVEHVVNDVGEALGDGAHEIDLVLPYKAFLRGERRVARTMIEGVRDVAGADRTLKVILETGALGDGAAIEAASRLAIEAGADFLKTSTGKIAVGATLEAAATMLDAIRASRRRVGLKPSGGLRTLAEARAYVDLAEARMGPGWVSPATFRLGASSLHEALVAALGLPASAAAAVPGAGRAG